MNGFMKNPWIVSPKYFSFSSNLLTIMTVIVIIVSDWLAFKNTFLKTKCSTELQIKRNHLWVWASRGPLCVVDYKYFPFFLVKFFKYMAVVKAIEWWRNPVAFSNNFLSCTFFSAVLISIPTRHI